MRLSTPQLLARDLAGADPLEALLMELRTDSGSVWQRCDCDVRLVVCRCHALSQRSIDSRGVWTRLNNATTQTTWWDTVIVTCQPCSETHRYLAAKTRRRSWLMALAAGRHAKLLLHTVFFISAGWAFDIRWSKCCLCVCLNVNQGGINRNCCTQRLVILHAQTYMYPTNESWSSLIAFARQKPGESDLFYGSKLPADNSWSE